MTSPYAPVASGTPWWKHGLVWMVVGGPAVVVVASFITLYLAVTRPDPVLDVHYNQADMSASKVPSGDATSMAPSMLARNHAATGVPAAQGKP